MTLANSKTNKRRIASNKKVAAAAESALTPKGVKSNTDIPTPLALNRMNSTAPALNRMNSTAPEIKEIKEEKFLKAKVLRESKATGEYPKDEAEAEQLKISHNMEELSQTELRGGDRMMDKMVAVSNEMGKDVKTVDQLADIPFVQFMGAGFAAFLRDNFAGINVDDINQKKIAEVLSKQLQKKQQQK